MLTSFMFCFFIYKAIYKESKNIPLSIYILFTSCFYFYAMNVVRQTIAIAVFIYSIQFIRKKEFKKYVILILLASCIHKIALIFLPIYFLAKIKISLKKFIILTIIVAISLPIINSAVANIVRGQKYENYINGYYLVSENSMVSILINIVVLTMCFYYEYKDKKNGIEDKELNVYKTIHMVGVWASLCVGLFPLASRIFVNFYHTQILTIPLLISKEKRVDMKLIIGIICVICFAILFYHSVGVMNGNNVLPYQTIFDR